MPNRWIFDREDPRTILLAAVAIMALGGFVGVRMLDLGGLLAFFAVVWLVVSAGQLVWAVIRYRRWRQAQDR